MKTHTSVLVVMIASCVGLFGCDQATSSKTAKKTAAEDPSVVVRVNGVPIYRDDVERLAKFLQSTYYNYSMEYASSLALSMSLMPRAAAVSKHQDLVEPLHKEILDIQQRIAAGEDFAKLAESASDMPITAQSSADEGGVLGKMDYLLGEWLAVLKPGEVSKPILTKLGWCLIRLNPDTITKTHMKAGIAFQSILLAFEKGGTPNANTKKYLEEAEIQIVDPKYEKIVPEWIKFHKPTSQ